MEQKLEFLCCEICAKRLRQYDWRAPNAWMRMCASFLMGNQPDIYEIEEDLDGPLRFLEVNGFIETHENEEDTLVRIKSSYVLHTDGGDSLPYFCSDYEAHWMAPEAAEE